MILRWIEGWIRLKIYLFGQVHFVMASWSRFLTSCQAGGEVDAGWQLVLFATG